MNYEVGQKIGYLTIQKIIVGPKGKSYLCKCDCGKEKIIYSCRMGVHKSCGCKTKKRDKKTTKYNRIYQAWSSMIYRCYKPTRASYNRYGAKGVTVCNEWLNSFASFLEWALANGYSDTLTLDRIDSTKPYSSDNCRWADYFVQEANKGISKNNKTGCKGVVIKGDRGKYRAYLTRKKQRKYLGRFNTIHESSMARELALEQYEISGTL